MDIPSRDKSGYTDMYTVRPSRIVCSLLSLSVKKEEKSNTTTTAAAQSVSVSSKVLNYYIPAFYYYKQDINL